MYASYVLQDYSLCAGRRLPQLNFETAKVQGEFARITALGAAPSVAQIAVKQQREMLAAAKQADPSQTSQNQTTSHRGAPASRWDVLVEAGYGVLIRATTCCW